MATVTFGQVPKAPVLAQAFVCFVLWIMPVICGFLDDNALKEMKINQNSEEVLLLSFTRAATPARPTAGRAG